MGKDNNVFRVVRPAEGVEMAEEGSASGMLVPLADIKIGDRHRRDLGDVAALANSIDDVGLLQPIVLTPDLELVSGERRIRAVETLGHDAIEAFIVHGLDEASARLRAERDENTCRKAFTPTEEHAVYEALLELERPKAQERRQEAGRVYGRGQIGGGNFPQPISGKSRQQAAAGATGSPNRYKTLDKVGEVKAAFSSPQTPEPIRKVAEQALAEMDSTGRVDGGYQKVKDAERAAAAPKPNPAVEEFVNESKTVQDASYVHEFMRAFARSGDWLRYDPQRVSELIDETEFALLHRHIVSAERFVKAVTSARRGLRLISGGEK